VVLSAASGLAVATRLLAGLPADRWSGSLWPLVTGMLVVGAAGFALPAAGRPVVLGLGALVERTSYSVGWLRVTAPIVAATVLLGMGGRNIEQQRAAPLPDREKNTVYSPRCRPSGPSPEVPPAGCGSLVGRERERVSEIGLRPLAQPPVLREQVYETLEELIIDHTLSPGRRLLESDLAEQLNVSRNPVREALTLLAHSGWVDLRPRQGAVVHEPTAKEVEDFFRVRAVLEEESARLAARNATDADIAELRTMIKRGTEAIAAGDEGETVSANAAFHARVGEIADNEVLDEVLALMKKRLRWYFAPVARQRGQASWDEHGALLDALQDHDEDRATKVMRAHSEATAHRYRQNLRGQQSSETV